LEVLRELQVDLCEPLSIGPGQRIAILGEATAVSDTVTARGAVPIMVLPTNGGWAARALGRPSPRPAAATQARLDLATASVDHALLPAFDRDLGDWLPAEIHRVLKPGGEVVVGLQGGPAPAGLAARIGPRDGTAGRRAGRADLAACLRWLGAGRLKVVARYGVHAGVGSRHELVPLDHGGAVLYCAEHLWSSPSRWERLVQRSAALLVAAGQAHRLFERFVLVARPSTEGKA